MPGSPDKAKYLNSPETPLFNKSRTVFGLDLGRQKIVETRTVAVVEGYADVVMAHQYGATNVVSPLGTALTEPTSRSCGGSPTGSCCCSTPTPPATRP